MTITRAEFKEFVGLYREAWNTYCKHTEYLNENFLEELIFPALDWIKEKIGLSIPNEDFDIVMDLINYGEAAISIDIENNECEYTDDLDKIYDYYIRREH